MIPELGRSSGEGKDYPLQYSGLENSMNCIGHGVAKSRTRLSDFHFGTFTIIYSESPGRDRGFPGGSVVKNLLANAGNARDVGSISGWGRSPEGGNGNPLQYSCLENPMNRGAWWATVHVVAKSLTGLSMHAGVPRALLFGGHCSL